ncbi:DUF3592 domain-containing protein [Spirosoma aureum]|uniref:DUF3592 domain-containing protein n=1 Tax=Spirosoma aureum TaxID=2692134 RepID=A0A6G9AYD7_9BACT|nr:DUF3592 domain-containing protein [Spirosoma aureum]QIP17430.1 DUF3592 domain-containing protein [Spirosoma aureum]
MNPFARRLGAGFGLLGIGLLTGAFFSYRNIRQWLSDTDKATGRVIGLDKRQSVDRFNDRDSYSTAYYPVVQFSGPSGQSITFRSSVGSSSPDYQIGESVSVLYDRQNPDSARVDAFMSIWLVPLVLGVLGIVFMIAGLSLSFFNSVTYVYTNGAWHRHTP